MTLGSGLLLPPFFDSVTPHIIFFHCETGVSLLLILLFVFMRACLLISLFVFMRAWRCHDTQFRTICALSLPGLHLMLSCFSCKVESATWSSCLFSWGHDDDMILDSGPFFPPFFASLQLIIFFELQSGVSLLLIILFVFKIALWLLQLSCPAWCRLQKKSTAQQHASQGKLMLAATAPKKNDLEWLGVGNRDAIWKQWVNKHLLAKSKAPGTLISSCKR